MPKLEIKEINDGFIAPEIIEEEEYVLGAGQVIQDPLMENANWSESLPDNEAQFTPEFDSKACVTFVILNCIEILLKTKFGLTKNFSERYVGILADNTPRGNTPQRVAETIRRTAGLILQEELELDSSIRSWEEFHQPKPMRTSLLRLGQEWLQNWEFKHEWLWRGNIPLEQKQFLMKTALSVSPLGVSVYAWARNPETGLYEKPEGAKDGHFCTVYGYVEGKKWLVLDHYPPFLKELDWNFNFEYGKRFALYKRVKGQQTWYQKLLAFISRILWP